jgi:hypothetical protein
MVFPFMFDEIHALQKLKEAAHLLAAKEDWPPLYDVGMLNNNKVCSYFLISISVLYNIHSPARCYAMP